MVRWPKDTRNCYWSAVVPTANPCWTFGGLFAIFTNGKLFFNFGKRWSWTASKWRPFL